MKLKNILFIVGLLFLISIYFYSKENEKEEVKTSLISVMREQAEQSFFSSGTSSPSFTDRWKEIYLEQYNHLTGCRKYYGLEQDKDNALLCRTKQRNLIEEAKLQLGLEFNPDKPMTQYDLFYGLDTMNNVYVSQSSPDHYKSNGLLSVDIATGGKKLPVYAMDCNLEICEWNVSTEYNEGKGHIVILTNEEKNMMFRYGHTKLTTTKTSVLTADEVGVILCPNDEGAGITTGCHLDFSFWTKSNGNWIQAEYKDDKNYNAEKRIEDLIVAKKGTIFFTTYNADSKQTDNNPCQGANGNVCELYKQGKNPISLSRDLIQARTEADKANGYCSNNCPFKYGDTVTIKPIDHWQGEFSAVVVDTMAKRFKNRGDLFKINKKDNTSFSAIVTK